MKHFASITLCFLIFQLCSAQHVLFLKNGDKIKGKLDGYKNDSIIYSMHGNSLKFKTTDIAALYLDDSIAPQDLSAKISGSSENNGDHGSISGVITYYFNKNYGDRPDVGAEVFIVDAKSVPDFNLATVDSFYYASFYRNTYLWYQSMGSVPNNIISEVAKYNATDDEMFHALDERATANVVKIEYGKNVVKAVVDGSGSYTAKLKPGNYYVYIESNNRKGNSITEVTGKVRCERAIVKAGENTNVSCNFGVH